MKLIHIVNLTVAALIIFGCYMISVKKARQQTIQKSLGRVLLFSGFGVIVYTLAMIFSSRLLADIGYSAYHIILVAMVLALASFVSEYTGVRTLFSKELYVVGVLSLADVVILALNPFLHCVFRVAKTDDIIGHTYYYISRRETLYIYHFSLAYLIMALAVIMLIKKILRSPKIYKLKYAIILLIIIAVMAGHAFYVTMDSTFDYSIIFYAAVAAALFYFSIIYVPRGLMEKLMFFTVANMKDGIICVDIDGKVAHYNKTAKEYCCATDDGSDVSEYITEWFANNPEALTNDELTWKETRNINGEKCRFINDYKRICDSDGKYVGCFFIYHDRTKEYKRLAEEKYRSSHDSLTGLYNKEHFCKKASKLIKENPGTSYVIVCTDVKSFKIINEIFGVHRGDDLLLCMAGDVNSLAAEDEYVCGRLTGDRFAVCMNKDHYSEEALLGIASKFGNFFGEDVFKVQMHFGVYEVKDRELSVSVMCDRANFAIHTIKDSYQSVVAYYNEKLRDSFLSEQKMISEFEAALGSGQFIAYIQPQISAEGHIRGGEALVRWLHPSEGMVSPGKFIGTFETTGLISRLDSYMWELACIQLCKWRSKGLTDNYLSVNISKKDFFLMDVYGTLTSLIEKYSLDPKCLHLEITETAIMNIPEEQQHLISQLRDYGFIVEIDDFGSGYSSLNTLKDLYVDVLKIDMGFLEKTENTERSMKILRMIIELAKSLNMAVITEGVETDEQVRFLRECGCDVFQGYFFAKPMEIADFEEKYLSLYK